MKRLVQLGLLLCGLTLVATSVADSPDNSKATQPAKQKVVYHVSESGKVRFVLNNINNHIDGVGGPEQVEIVVVVNGEGHNGFIKTKASQEVATDVELLEVQGVRFEICGYSLDAYGTSVQDLVGNFKRLEQGGVARMVELQQQGFAYLRP